MTEATRGDPAHSVLIGRGGGGAMASQVWRQSTAGTSEIVPAVTPPGGGGSQDLSCSATVAVQAPGATVECVGTPTRGLTSGVGTGVAGSGVWYSCNVGVACSQTGTPPQSYIVIGSSGGGGGAVYPEHIHRGGEAMGFAILLFAMMAFCVGIGVVIGDHLRTKWNKEKDDEWPGTDNDLFNERMQARHKGLGDEVAAFHKFERDELRRMDEEELAKYLSREAELRERGEAQRRAAKGGSGTMTPEEAEWRMNRAETAPGSGTGASVDPTGAGGGSDVGTHDHGQRAVGGGGGSGPPSRPDHRPRPGFGEGGGSYGEDGA